jgi:hypothetical protein
MNENFDWEFYINRYSDLRKSNINTKEKAYRHWVQFGKKEGRVCYNNNKNLLDELDENIIKEYHIDKDKSDNFIGKKIIAVIPVHGRELLLKYTIRRLYKKNNLYKVICVGETAEEKKVVLQENGIWVEYNNNPLGKKWNIGFKVAQIYNPDAVLFVGSSDWVSSDWIEDAYKYIDDFGIIGKHEFTMADITNKILKTCHWLGYPNHTNRNKETIGIGRLVSKKLLDKIDEAVIILTELSQKLEDLTRRTNILENRISELMLSKEPLNDYSVAPEKINFNNHRIIEKQNAEILELSNTINKLTAENKELKTKVTLAKLQLFGNAVNEIINPVALDEIKKIASKLPPFWADAVDKIKLDNKEQVFSEKKETEKYYRLRKDLRADGITYLVGTIKPQREWEKCFACNCKNEIDIFERIEKSKEKTYTENDLIKITNDFRKKYSGCYNINDFVELWIAENK